MLAEGVTDPLFRKRGAKWIKRPATKTKQARSRHSAACPSWVVTLPNVFVILSRSCSAAKLIPAIALVVRLYECIHKRVPAA